MFGPFRLPDVDDAARAEGHDFVTLPAGKVHVRLDGPEDGPRVCLVHGTTSPLFTFDRLAWDLVDAGFRVLRFDLYGRGLSDRPSASYDLAFFADQLRGVLDAVGFDGEVALLGWSLGAVIAAEVASAPGHGRQVSRLVLLAPAGFPVVLPPAARVARWPVVGDVVMALIGRRKLARSWRAIFVDPDQHPVYGERFEEQLRYRGVVPAVLSTLRHAPLEDAHTTWQALAAADVPTLILWGRQDAICPHANVDLARQALPGATIQSVDAAHALHIEAPDEVGAAALAHLGGRAPAPVTSLAEAEARIDRDIARTSAAPWDRYVLRVRYYARFGRGTAEHPDGFGEAELAFLRWEIRRGTLRPTGSPWWRALNSALNRDAELAGLLHEGGVDGPPDGPVAKWLAFLRQPTPTAWYRAHNASIVAGYLRYRELAQHEDTAEQAFLNEVLFRVLFAQALASGAAFGSLGALAGDPRRRAVELITQIEALYPSVYPADADLYDGRLRRRPGDRLERLLDEGLILPHLDELYTWAADEIGMPELLTLIDGYP